MPLADRVGYRLRGHHRESLRRRRGRLDIEPPQVEESRRPTTGEMQPATGSNEGTTHRPTRTGRVSPSQFVRAATATGPTGRRASGAARASTRPPLTRAVTLAAHHETYLQVDELSRRRKGPLSWRLVRQVPGTVSKCPPRTTDSPATASSPLSWRDVLKVGLFRPAPSCQPRASSLPSSGKSRDDPPSHSGPARSRPGLHRARSRHLCKPAPEGQKCSQRQSGRG